MRPLSTPETCPDGPHRPPQGPNEEVSMCSRCWGLSWEMRPEGETYGEHLPDCAHKDPRHTGYCIPGGAGHPRAAVIRGYWP